MVVRAVASLLPFVKSKGKTSVYSICDDDPYYNGKFSANDYKKVYKDGIHYIYKLENEDGVKTAYLLCADDNGLISFKSIRLAINDILKNKIDIVLYVGKVGFFQTILTKVPRKFEPKLLPMTCDLISMDEKFKDMLDYANWDFGLKNYDVR